MYGDFHEFCRLRNLLTKGASQRNLKEWYLKGQMRTASVSPGNSTDELDKSFSSPSRRKQQRVSVEVNPVRNRIPYYYPEQVPGPGAYNVTSTLLRTTHNRKADFVPQNQPRPSSRKEFSKPISLEEFERTNKISGVLSFTEVGNGTYLNHKKQYRTRSAPSGGRPPAAVPISKQKYNPIIDLAACPSDAIIGRWSSVAMESYKWNRLDKYNKKDNRW